MHSFYREFLSVSNHFLYAKIWPLKEERGCKPSSNAVLLPDIWKVGICDFKIEHFAALIIAYLGISGNLPYAALFGKKIP